MRSTLSLALTAALMGGVLLAPAGAGAFSEHLDDFVTRLEQFAAQIDPASPTFKQQRKLMKKVQKKLKKKSASLATDAALAGKLGKLIAKGGPEFEQLATEIAAAMDDIRDNVNNLVENMEFRAQALPDGKLKTKAVKSVAKMKAELADVDDADLNRVGKALKAALLERRKAAKIVKKAEKQLEETF